MQRDAPKRSGHALGDVLVAKVARSQAEPVVGLPSEEGPMLIGDTGSEPLEELAESPGPHNGGLLLLMDQPDKPSTARTSTPPIIRPQRPKMAAKKRLAIRCLPPSPMIPLPLGEWPCDGSASGDSEPPSDVVLLSTSLSEGGSDGPLVLRGVRASIQQSEVLGQALQVALDDCSRATEARTKVGRSRPSP